jgi:arylsulfatase A-like enzyme
MRAFILLGIPLLPATRIHAADGQPPARPNILFIMSDDHTAQAVGAYATLLKGLNPTPNIDTLSDEGMVFDNAFVTNSICTPSRACIITGQYNHTNGVFDLDGRLPPANQALPIEMRKAGYQTAVIGKWHLVSDPIGFDHWHILPGQGIYYNPPMRKNGVQAKETGYVTDVITDRSIEWLKARDKSKPFLLMCQHKAPHREWAPALRHLNHNADKPYPEPATLFDDYSGRGKGEKNQDMTLEKTFTELDAKFKYPAGMTDAEKAEWDKYYKPRNEQFQKDKPTGKELVRWRYNRYLHDYLGCIKAVDEGVGKVLDYLDAEKLTDNTVVIYTSDQGFYLGEHGWFDKRWIFEESLRSPCLVRWPGVVKPGSTSGAITSVIDFAPTILSAAGVKVPAEIQGKDMTAVLKGDTPNDWRKSFYYHYYEYPGPHSVPKHYGVVTDQFKLVRFYEKDFDYWELFDTKADPKELKSVYDDPKYADTRKTLEAELAKLRKDLKVPDPDPPETDLRKK